MTIKINKNMLDITTTFFFFINELYLKKINVSMFVLHKIKVLQIYIMTPI